ncbi:helix-turn-helix domain-containing protein [Phenylobacterium aquaticum]
MDSRAVDLQISRLRRKLQTHGAAEFIQTRWGPGYVLDCQVLRA